MEKISKIITSHLWVALGLAFLIILLGFILFGFKYKLVSSNGEFFRINEMTGEVQKIQGTRFIAIDRLNDIKKMELGQLKEWETRQIGKNEELNVDIKTLWRNGKLYYNVKITPFDKIEKIRKKNYYASTSITINLKDADNFYIKGITLNFNDMIHYINDDSLVTSNSIELSYEDMKYVDDIDVTWNFDD